jgi:2'-5' RNA ligase
MKRIFTAIDISEETREKAAGYVKQMRGEFPNLRVGWEKPEKLHLTLKFLGDIDEIELDNLIGAVENTAKRISKFNLQITQTGAFPSVKKARVIWLGVKDASENLQKLNEILEAECAAKNFARETRSFKPHLTIARLREPQNSKTLIEKHLENEFEAAEFEVSEITIYESVLQKSSSIYTVVSKSELNKF